MVLGAVAAAGIGAEARPLSSAKTIDIEALKAAVEMPRIVAETLALTKVGRDHVGLCPFHNEHTPSFMVFVDHYHCFGCAAWRCPRLARQRSPYDVPRRRVLPRERRQRRGHASDRPTPEADQWLLKIARMIWQESTLPVGSFAETYLHSRGLDLPEEPVIRFHPTCPYSDHRLPAAVALMTDPVTASHAVSIARSCVRMAPARLTSRRTSKRGCWACPV